MLSEVLPPLDMDPAHGSRPSRSTLRSCRGVFMKGAARRVSDVQDERDRLPERRFSRPLID
jgi:hypothetical protein